MRTLGFALLGYGDVGRKHLYALRNVPFHFPELEVLPEVVVVYGRREGRLKEFASTYGIKHYVTDLSRAVNFEGVDVVDVALPNYLHYLASVETAKAGKHVMCEKPLATNSEEAWRMYEVAERAGVKHGVMYNYRWLPAVRLAKRIIESGAIGRVIHFRGTYLEDYGSNPLKPLTWRYRASEAGSGTLGDNATHVIDLARYLVGEVIEVCGKGATFIKERPLPEGGGRGVVDTDDEFISIVTFENGALGSVEASRVASGRRNWLEVEVRGSKGFIYWNLNRLNELEVFIEGGEVEGVTRVLVTDEKNPYVKRFWPPNAPIGLVDGFTIAFAEFIKSITEGGEYLPNFRDGAINCSVMDRMLESWRAGRCLEVELPR